MTLDAADQLQILQLVTTADACATARDGEGYVAFSPGPRSCRARWATQTAAPRSVRSSLVCVWAGESPGALHLTVNAVIDASGSDPSVESVMLMVGSGAAPAIVGSAKVRQVVVRTSDGWRISLRAIATEGA